MIFSENKILFNNSESVRKNKAVEVKKLEKKKHPQAVFGVALRLSS